MTMKALSIASFCDCIDPAKFLGTEKPAGYPQENVRVSKIVSLPQASRVSSIGRRQPFGHVLDNPGRHRREYAHCLTEKRDTGRKDREIQRGTVTKDGMWDV